MSRVALKAFVGWNVAQQPSKWKSPTQPLHVIRHFSLQKKKKPVALSSQVDAWTRAVSATSFLCVFYLEHMPSCLRLVIPFSWSDRDAATWCGARELLFYFSKLSKGVKEQQINLKQTHCRWRVIQVEQPVIYACHYVLLTETVAVQSEFVLAGEVRVFFWPSKFVWEKLWLAEHATAPKRPWFFLQRSSVNIHTFVSCLSIFIIFWLVNPLCFPSGDKLFSPKPASGPYAI